MSGGGGKKKKEVERKISDLEANDDDGSKK